VEHTDGEGEGERYRLLETVREYAGERLAAGGERAAVRGRHLGWCVALAEAAEPQLLGAEQATWLARLDHEHDNMRAALRWACDQGADEQGLRLAGALWRFWSLRGFLSEGRGWLDTASTHTTVPADIRARALSGAGNLAYDQGDYRYAAARHEEALVLRRVLGDRVGIANSLNNLGNVTAVLGDHRLGTTMHEEALSLRRELGDRQGIAISLNNLGGLAAAYQDYHRAAILHEEALSLRRDLGDRVGIANSLSSLGTVLAERGEYERATDLLKESLSLRRTLADKTGIVGSLYTLGSVLALHGGDESAATLLGESLRLSHEIGARDRMAEVLEILAWLAVGRGQPHRAARVGGAAEALRQALGVDVLPDREAGHEQAVQAMRAALGEEVFAATWAEGRALPVEELVALAAGDHTSGQ
jgi:non-specific serine/threonine protein kinase